MILSSFNDSELDLSDNIMKTYPKGVLSVSLLGGLAVIAHFIPTFFRKVEEEKPKSLSDILKSSPSK